MKVYRQGDPSAVRCPLVLWRVAAGFPSPADDYVERPLDLNEYLIKHPAATFFIRVTGDSMTGAGINSGDLLIVDRSLEAGNGNIVLAILDGEFTVKRFSKTGGDCWLVPENDAYEPVQITGTMDFQVWGVVVHVIHKVL